MTAAIVHFKGEALKYLLTQLHCVQYLFSIFLDECINAFYDLRGFWPMSARESLRFISQRDPALGDLLEQTLVAPQLSQRLELGRRVADYLFKDIPAPARID